MMFIFLLQLYFCIFVSTFAAVSYYFFHVCKQNLRQELSYVKRNFAKKMQSNVYEREEMIGEQTDA